MRKSSSDAKTSLKGGTTIRIWPVRSKKLGYIYNLLGRHSGFWYYWILMHFSRFEEVLDKPLHYVTDGECIIDALDSASSSSISSASIESGDSSGSDSDTDSNSSTKSSDTSSYDANSDQGVQWGHEEGYIFLLKWTHPG